MKRSEIAALLLFVLLLFGAAARVSQAADATSTERKIDRIVARLIEQNGIPTRQILTKANGERGGVLRGG